MKKIAILFSVFNNRYPFERCFDNLSAFDRCLSWAESIDDVQKIVILCSSKKNLPDNLSVDIEIVEQEQWTVALLFKTLCQVSEGHDSIVYAWADSPFYDSDLTDELCNTHKKFGAEYTFADGYPGGMTPEILDAGTARLLEELAKDNKDPVVRDSIFLELKKDINAFEIETLIAPKDLRYLRLQFSCDNKRNTLQCQRLFQLKKEQPKSTLWDLAEVSVGVLKTLPAYYGIQIATACAGACTFCPYPQAFQEKEGINPYQSNQYMSFDDFKHLVNKISDFSDDAVLCLSLWGDAVRHPQFADFVKEVLSYPALSLLLETTGEMLTKEIAETISAIIAHSPKRTNGQQAVNWIVSIDAHDSQMYRSLHGHDFFEKALGAVEMLCGYFPGAVYPQFIRLEENEIQMENFYRHWKEKNGQLIIQKYDWFCGTLANKKVVDLSPVQRNPCWHLRRDMSILIDGSVPFCKEGLLKEHWGNALTDSLQEIWNKSNSAFEFHLKHHYEGLCKDCDEYYTYNF